jgi:DNA repair exonuclease SbcCD ATPase subunit
MSNEREQTLSTKVENFTKELSGRLTKIEEKVQNNTVQLITLEGKIAHVTTEIKHIASDLKEIKSPGQSLSQQELLLTQHQQELSQVSKMIDDVTALDREIHRIKGIFTIAPFITAAIAAILTAVVIKIL